MGNSTRTLQSVLDFAVARPDLAGVGSPAAGWSNIAVRIGNQVMTDLLSQTFNFKFNRISPPIPPFYTNQWQQDYAVVDPVTLASLKTLAWIEDCQAIDINATFPQAKFTLDCVQVLPAIGSNYQSKGKICWLPNDQLQYSTWGGPASNVSNPQPLQVIAPLLGATQNPQNPWLQVQDPNGNFQLLTTFGTTGSSQPSWPTAGAAAGTQTNDGTCRWTVLDPKGQGFRIVPVPAQGARIWQIKPIGQAKPIPLASRNSMIDPIPDDQATYFEQGFVARCYEFSPDPGKQKTWETRWTQWLAGITQSLKGQTREAQNYGMYPERALMDDGVLYGQPTPAWPFSNWR